MSVNTLLSSNIIVPIIVAFIGFLIAVTTAVIAKEQKISEFRRDWIEKLREDIAEMVSISYSFIIEKEKMKRYQTLDPETISPELFQSNKDSNRQSMIIMGDILKTSLLIKLRLNQNEHKPILDAIKLLIANLQTDKVTIAISMSNIDDVQQLAHLILKTEWEKVKKGENQFINFKYISKILASTFLISMWVLFSIATLQSEIFQW